MRKFVLLTLLVIFGLGLSLPLSAEATETKSYSNEVKVSISSSGSKTIRINSPYQLLNLTTNQTTIIPANTIINIETKDSKVVVSFKDFNQSSVKGFKLQELEGPHKIVEFTTSTPLRKGATDNYPIVKTLNKGENAHYLSQFVNAANELWYRVTTGAYTGWVKATTVILKDAPTLSLATLDNDANYRGSFILEMNKSNSLEIINFLDIEDYLKGVVPCEMPASWPMEALKAQAIVARSYAMKASVLTNTTASQVYGGYNREHERTNRAIQETEGLVVKYNGKVIQTFFHSTSGGKTANVWDVWNSSPSVYPYLSSVTDIYEVSPYSNWTKTFGPNTILQSFGFPLTAKIYDIKLEKTGANGEVSGVTLYTSVGSKTIRGNENTIRRLFPLNGSTYLYSNWFIMNLVKTLPVSVQTKISIQQIPDIKGKTIQTVNEQIPFKSSKIQIQTANGIITINEEVTSIILEGKGWGHRVGMSQYGAKGFAEHNWKAEDIVKYYFPGTTISK